MAVRGYEAFLKTVELGSLTLAAQALGRTQSAISHSISGFEEELGLTLLSRSKGGIRLTDDGRRLLPYIKAMAEAHGALYKEAAVIRGTAGGRIRIGAFTSVAVHWLPGMIKGFGRLYPQVEFEMYNGDYSDVDRWLKDGSIDLAFITLPAPEGCSHTVLKEDELVAILPQDHPLAAMERVPTTLLAAEPFITLLQASDQDIRRALGKAGVKPDVRFSTKDDYAIIAMVEQGLGVSIVPRLLIAGRSDKVAVRSLEPAASRTIALAMPVGKDVGIAAELFMQYAAQWVKEQGI